ncbi:hypothetical protein NP493_1013g00000 [Ridgeia piscesae]|uniref:Tetraspanin n=1 Tax=Ridgeia piscesae TaxID=27915 RepID=A0AAD9NKI9_RIDPI|nr:hypothetical protein NP493_1013g00000 [Ridgeia piscesae]
MMDVMSRFSTSDQTVDEALQNTSLLESASIVFIAVGAFLFIVSFAGCCGALKESPCLLVLYIFIVVILMFVQIAAVVMLVLFKSAVEDKTMNFMHQTITEKYIGATADENDKMTESKDPVSLSWDFIMAYFECCGTTNYTDFRVNATKWNATITYSGYSFNASVPVMCCTMKDHTLFPGHIADIEFVDLKGCLVSSYANATNQMPCYEKVRSEMLKYTYIGLGVICAIVFIELLGVIAAVSAYRGIKNDK